MRPIERFVKLRLPAAGRAVVRGALSRPWTVMIAWTALWSVVHAFDAGWTWHYQVTGTRALFSSQALHLYARHPELQMGPLSFVVGAPFVLLLPGPAGRAAGMVFMLLIGLLVVRELRVLHIRGRTLADRAWLPAGLLILMVWTELAVHWGHLDDALALYCALLGVRAALSGRAYRAALLFALSADFKPWTVPIAALLLAAPRRQWLPLAAVWSAVVAAAWSPFIVADPGTMDTVRFAIPISPASTLHLLGLAGRGTPPWCRYAQVFGGFALAAIAVRYRRYGSVFLICIAVRLLLDPGTKNYYDAGLMLSAGIFDVVATATLPYATIGAAALVYLPSYLLSAVPLVQGVLRTAALLALLAAALAMPDTGRRGRSRAGTAGFGRHLPHADPDLLPFTRLPRTPIAPYI